MRWHCLEHFNLISYTVMYNISNAMYVKYKEKNSNFAVKGIIYIRS